MKDRQWWDRLKSCDGITKSGKRCNRYRMRPYEVQPGDLYIPSMCVLHIDQEPPNTCSTRQVGTVAKNQEEQPASG